MFQNLLSKVGYGDLGCYTLEQEKAFEIGIWNVFDAVRKADSVKCSIFISPEQSKFATNCSVLKQLRHPYILKTYDYIESTNKKEIYLITERVTPFHKLELDKTVPNVWGLYQIVTALSFLHQSGKCHNLVDIGSIFVTETLDLRLGGFELCGPNSQSTDFVIMQRKGEVKLRHHATIDVFAIDARLGTQSQEYLDLLGIVNLIENTFGGSIPMELTRYTNELRQPRNPNMKYAQKLLEVAFLKDHPAVRIMHFLENIAIKDQEEKVKFFENLYQELDHLPAFLYPQILPHLLQTASLMEQFSSVLLPSVVKLGSKIDDEEKYKKEIVPFILKCFASSDRSVRYRLLTALQEFISHIEKTLISTKILPEILNGFRDTNSSIREVTIKTMVALAPMVSKEEVQDKIAKELLKALSDPEKPLRTNACICFGKIAEYLANPSPLLKQAFVKSLGDDFTPSRMAALNAIQVCVEKNHLLLADVAQFIIPALALRLGDPDRAVVEKTYDVLFEILKVLREQQRKTAEEQRDSTKSEMAEAAAGGAANADTSSTWGGWAFSKVELLQGSLTKAGSEAAPGTSTSVQDSGNSNQTSGTSPANPANTTRGAPAPPSGPSVATGSADQTPKQNSDTTKLGGSAQSTHQVGNFMAPPSTTVPKQPPPKSIFGTRKEEDDLFADFSPPGCARDIALSSTAWPSAADPPGGRLSDVFGKAPSAAGNTAAGNTGTATSSIGKKPAIEDPFSGGDAFGGGGWDSFDSPREPFPSTNSTSNFLAGSLGSNPAGAQQAGKNTNPVPSSTNLANPAPDTKSADLDDMLSGLTGFGSSVGSSTTITGNNIVSSGGMKLTSVVSGNANTGFGSAPVVGSASGAPGTVNTAYPFAASRPDKNFAWPGAPPAGGRTQPKTNTSQTSMTFGTPKAKQSIKDPNTLKKAVEDDFWDSF